MKFKGYTKKDAGRVLFWQLFIQEKKKQKLTQKHLACMLLLKHLSDACTAGRPSRRCFHLFNTVGYQMVSVCRETVHVCICKLNYILFDVLSTRGFLVTMTHWSCL